MGMYIYTVILRRASRWSCRITGNGGREGNEESKEKENGFGISGPFPRFLSLGSLVFLPLLSCLYLRGEANTEPGSEPLAVSLDGLYWTGDI